jgi:flagellar protein FlaG
MVFLWGTAAEPLRVSSQRVPGPKGKGKYTEVLAMGMEIPGIIKGSPVPDMLAKEARVVVERQPRQPDQQPEQQKISRQELEQQAKVLERTFLAFNRKVVLSVNDTINQVIIKVVDAETDKVIKEIPAEEIQRLIARIKETIGLLVDEKI